MELSYDEATRVPTGGTNLLPLLKRHVPAYMIHSRKCRGYEPIPGVTIGMKIAAIPNESVETANWSLNQDAQARRRCPFLCRQLRKGGWNGGETAIEVQGWGTPEGANYGIREPLPSRSRIALRESASAP